MNSNYILCSSGMVVRQREILIAVARLKDQNRVKILNFDHNGIKF